MSRLTHPVGQDLGIDTFVRRRTLSVSAILSIPEMILESLGADGMIIWTPEHDQRQRCLSIALLAMLGDAMAGADITRLSRPGMGSGR
jgi:hypothetical protein